MTESQLDPELPLFSGRERMYRTGILPIQDLKAELGRQILTLAPLAEQQIQPSSLDLRLGDYGYRVKASFLPGPGVSVQEKAQSLSLERIDLRQDTVLERGSIYIIPLLESLSLKRRYLGVANPKSSTGRLDIFTRLICDGSVEFDRVPANYQGPLFAEISPRSFHVKVRRGSRLLQLRIQHGNPSPSESSLRELHEKSPLTDSSDERLNIKRAGLGVSVDTTGLGGGDILGYRARRGVEKPIDVDLPGICDPHEFWLPVRREGSGGIILEPDEFYILVSKEAVTVPPDQAAEMIAYDTLVGEFRVHYAGFFDPGFGYHEDGRQGTRAVLEVRSHEVPFLLEDGQMVGRLLYQRLTAEPETLYGRGIGSSYSRQGLKLAKHFRDWTA